MSQKEDQNTNVASFGALFTSVALKTIDTVQQAAEKHSGLIKNTGETTTHLLTSLEKNAVKVEAVTKVLAQEALKKAEAATETIQAKVLGLRLSFELGVTKEDLEKELLKAAASGDIKTVKKNLRQNLKLNAKDDANRKVLSIAAYNGHNDIVKLILEKSTTKNHSSSMLGSKFDPLAIIAAASQGHTAVVQTLVEAKTNIQMKDAEGNTALMHAVANNKEDTVKYLLSVKANPSLINRKKETALTLAQDLGNKKIISLIKKTLPKPEKKTSSLSSFFGTLMELGKDTALKDVKPQKKVQKKAPTKKRKP